ncbi:MAG: hypothetical protein D3909_05840 [Candidatus Electrothrix sp. ATG1]|nr:hypothetical protein [Candidatus Electrothrix sp. ATG1]
MIEERKKEVLKQERGRYLERNIKPTAQMIAYGQESLSCFEKQYFFKKVIKRGIRLHGNQDKIIKGPSFNYLPVNIVPQSAICQAFYRE